MGETAGSTVTVDERAATFEVTPVRCSADPAALGAFLASLGLTPRPAADGEVVFAGRGGQVRVVPARQPATLGLSPGETALTFTVTGASGNDAQWLPDRHGRRIGLVARDAAESGPQEGSHPASASMDIVARYPSTDVAADAKFFAGLGLVGGAVDDPWRYGLRNAAHRGVISLDAAAEFGPAPVAAAPPGEPVRVRVGFETSEPLDALAGRLRAAGYATATVVDDRATPYVHVVDPDGQHIEVHLTA